MPNEQAESRGALVPRSLDELGEFAKRLSASRLLPPDLKNPADIAVTMLQGIELGLRPMQALRSIHVVKGRPVMSADLIVALCLRSPACRYFSMVESDDKHAVYETHRHGAPHSARMSYSIADAQRAGLTNKDNWKSHPAAMLRARCKAALARDVYPDIAMGLYDPAEADEFPDERKPGERNYQTAAFPVAGAPRLSTPLDDVDDDLPQWAGGNEPDAEGADDVAG